LLICFDKVPNLIFNSSNKFGTFKIKKLEDTLEIFSLENEEWNGYRIKYIDENTMEVFNGN